MSDTTKTPAPETAKPVFGSIQINGTAFRTIDHVIASRKTKDGKSTPERRFPVFFPASKVEALSLLTAVLASVETINTKEQDPVGKFVADILQDRCEEALNAVMVKNPDGTFSPSKPEAYLPELVNVSRATRGGGEKIKDIKARRDELSLEIFDLKELRDQNNNDAAIAAVSGGKYKTIAQVNTVLAQWTQEFKALRARVAEHEAAQAARAEKREKKAAEKAASEPVKAA